MSGNALTLVIFTVDDVAALDIWSGACLRIAELDQGRDQMVVVDATIVTGCRCSAVNYLKFRAVTQKGST